jgi:hypothetical protein
MRTFEEQAANEVKAGLVVEYVAMPSYRGSTSTIPNGFWLTYIAQYPDGSVGKSDSVYIRNDANGAMPNLGN